MKTPSHFQSLQGFTHADLVLLASLVLIAIFFSGWQSPQMNKVMYCDVIKASITSRDACVSPMDGLTRLACLLSNAEQQWSVEESCQ